MPIIWRSGLFMVLHNSWVYLFCVICLLVWLHLWVLFCLIFYAPWWCGPIPLFYLQLLIFYLYLIQSNSKACPFKMATEFSVSSSPQLEYSLQYLYPFIEFNVFSLNSMFQSWTVLDNSFYSIFVFKGITQTFTAFLFNFNELFLCVFFKFL